MNIFENNVIEYAPIGTSEAEIKVLCKFEERRLNAVRKYLNRHGLQIRSIDELNFAQGLLDRALYTVVKDNHTYFVWVYGNPYNKQFHFKLNVD